VKEGKNTAHPRTLNFRTAAIIFAAYFLSQIFVFAVLETIDGDRSGPMEGLLFPIIGSIVMVFVAIIFIPEDLRKTASSTFVMGKKC
jgi:hypothetical protein